MLFKNGTGSFNMDKILTFKEWFISKHIGEKWSRKWCEELYNGYINALVDEGIHDGDCVDEAQSCMLCLLENELQRYYEYTKGIHKLNN